MKKSRAIIVLAVLVLLLAVFGYTAAVGIGTENSGSASDIKLGLDLAGGVSIRATARRPSYTRKGMIGSISRSPGFRMPMRSWRSSESRVPCILSLRRIPRETSTIRHP